MAPNPELSDSADFMHPDRERPVEITVLYLLTKGPFIHNAKYRRMAFLPSVILHITRELRTDQMEQYH